MFDNAHELNSDISRWNVYKVTDMRGMFYKAYELNSDIIEWIYLTSNVHGICLQVHS